MKTFAGYWTTAEFTDPLGLLGWTKGPTSRNWNPTSRWEQTVRFSGPTETFNDFGNILCGDWGFKPFQLSEVKEGPVSHVTIVYYSDDSDGAYPRDPILTTWSLGSSVGNESILWAKKTVFALQYCPEAVRRVQVAVDVYNGTLGPLTNTYWQNAKLGTTQSLTGLMNALFNDLVAGSDADGSRLRRVDGSYATDEDLWHAAQLYRQILSGVTVVPRFEYVLRKTSVVFPRSKIGDSVIGSDMAASHFRVGYMFSYNGLLQHEPELSGQTQLLLNYPSMPRFWWWKNPPYVDETSDSRWTVTQEFRGFEAFSPYAFPWVTADNETFPTGYFDPTLWYDSPRGITEAGLYVEMPSNRSSEAPKGTKPGGSHQWPVAMQQAIYGNQDGVVDLG